MKPLRVWRHRLLWRLFHWVAALWVGLTFVLRLPLDLVFALADTLLVNLVKSGEGTRGAKCRVIDALSSRHCCKPSGKYANRWVFKIVCPHLGARPKHGPHYSSCEARLADIRPLKTWLWGFAAVLAVVIFWPLWPQVSALALRNARKGAAEQPGAGHATTATDPDPMPDVTGEEARGFAERGRRCFERKEYTEAIRCYTEALSFDPTMADAVYQLALCHLAVGDTQAARVSLEAALVLDPNAKQARAALAQLDRGSAGAQTPSPPEAPPSTEAQEPATEPILPKVHNLREVPPPRAEVREEPAPAPPVTADTPLADPVLRLEKECRQLFAEGDYVGAKLEAHRILAYRPGRASAQQILAACMRQTGDRAGAERVLHQILLAHPQRADVRLELADCYDEAGRTRAAEREYVRVVKDDPPCARAHIWLAEHYLKRGDVPKAYQHSKAAAELGVSMPGSTPEQTGSEPVHAPVEPVAAPTLPDRLSTRTDRPAPRVAAKIAVKPVVLGPSFDPPPVRPRLRLAVSRSSPRYSDLVRVAERLHKGDPKPAMDLARACAIEIDFVHAGLALAFQHQAQGHPGQARAEYERVLAQSPQNVTAMANLAAALTELGERLDRATELAADAQRLEPGNFRVADIYAWTLVKRGAYEQAMAILLPLVAHDPLDALVRLHMAEANMGAGHYAKARAMLGPLAAQRDSAQARQAQAALERLRRLE